MGNNADKTKTVVVTGATSGIGFETARVLVQEGASVIGTGRSEEKCRQAEAMIRKWCPEGKIRFLLADLSSMKQVARLAEDIAQVAESINDGSVDVLINNAGTFTNWYKVTEDGFETQFAVNHLAPFLLTGKLLPLLARSDAARVITVSSGSHYRTQINWDDIFYRIRYNCLFAYKQSKLANVLFTCEFNRRVGAVTNIKAFAADPGLVCTDIGLKGTGPFVSWFWKIRSRRGIEPSAAAESIAYLALEPIIQESPHVYWKDCKPVEPSPYSKREDVASRLWDLSEKMVNIKYAHFIPNPASTHA